MHIKTHTLKFIFFISFTGVLLLGIHAFLVPSTASAVIEHISYTATSLDGKPVSLDDFRGKVVLINVWATWCQPCREEMPSLQSLQQKFSDKNFTVIGVSIDDMGSQDRIKDFLQSAGITYTIWLDPNNNFESTFKTIGTPESFLIDRDGIILYHWRGPIDTTINDAETRIKNAIEQNTVTDIQSNPQTIGLAIAFIAGLLSFLSPCVLPLIPAYVTFITGMSLKELSGNTPTNTSDPDSEHHVPSQGNNLKIRGTVITKGGLFVLGFSIIFVALGSSVALVGSLFSDAAIWIARIGGGIIVLFGLHLLGIVHIPRLERQLKLDALRKPKHAGPLFVGMTFGAGWTPCIGPILAGILTIAASSTSVTTGATLLSAYSAGLAIPFIISAAAIDYFLTFFKKIRKWIPWIERSSGILLIGIGILLLTGYMTILSSIFGGSFISNILK